MHSQPGTYALILSSAVEKPVHIGKLGILELKAGFYVYVGSAFGPGGLQARIQHHIHHCGRPHWHLDYLRTALSVCEIWYTCDQTRREHQWATIHLQTRRSLLPLPGFGASDCRCPSHLFFYQSKPSGRCFSRKIHSRFKGHGRILIKRSFE